MPFALDQVLIWSRSFDEYEKIFAIKESDYSKTILGCADGAASFNATATAMGLNVVSCDPLYEMSIDDIRQKIVVSADMLYPKIVAAIDDFNWHYFKDPADLKDKRLAAANKFMEDFVNENARRRYIAAKLPDLPFADKTFDLALCGNFLFLYSKILSEEFHIKAIVELLRVAKEVRVFPLIGMERKTPSHLKCVLNMLDKRRIRYNIVDIDYHFTKDANQMLQIFIE